MHGDDGSMKILHLCLACSYVDKYSYQENLLPKYHKKMGYDVEIIASLETFDKKGNRCMIPSVPLPYENEDGILVVRLPYRDNRKLSRKLRRYAGLREALEFSSPDILFIHGCQFSDIDVVTSYLKEHLEVDVYVDNHADKNNSASTFLSEYIVHRLLWRKAAHAILPYAKKFWGVLPARVSFMMEQYGVPAEKCALLPMGGDDEEVDRACNSDSIMSVYEELRIPKDNLLIVTGGKIDSNKPQVLSLMRAFTRLDLDRANLLVFGPVLADMEQEFNVLLNDDNRIVYLPWATPSESYRYFAAASLVVFPGKHSVYWEQAASVGSPLLVRKWPGLGHLDGGGNVLYIEDDSVDLFTASLRKASEADTLKAMRASAERVAVRFRYSDIAKQSICESIASVPRTQTQMRSERD